MNKSIFPIIMVRYNIDDVTDDMVLGESIAHSSGKLLLGAGYRVARQYRKRLKELGFHSVLIQEEGTEDVKPKNVINESDMAALTGSMENMTNELSGIMGKFREDSHQNIHQMLFTHRKDLNRVIMNSSIVRQLETIIDQIMVQPEIVLNLAALKQAAGVFYERVVNVTITALCIGKKHGFCYDEIKQLAIGALNYHIGLLALPEELILKESSLTHEEKALYHQHTSYGYLILAQNPAIPATSAIVALQHHELQNGTGYPLGLKGSNTLPLKDISKSHVIHRFAEIVAVADTYHKFLEVQGKDETNETDAIKTTLKHLIRLGGESLNNEIVKTLVSIVPIYPVGTRVRITEAPSAKLKQYIGVVAKDNPDNLYRPVILLYRTLRGEKLEFPVVIDTAKTDNVEFELFV